MTKYLYIFIALLFLAPQMAGATAYYVDFSTTTAGGIGTATTTAFANLDQFTEVARAGGDIAFVRRGVASTTNVSNLDFTSDGTNVNPIKISADYDNLWSDFATSSQTYTIATASTTMTASANQSDIVIGDWVYVVGDCQETYNSISLNKCEFAYEVQAVASTSIELYLPYRGNQTGGGLDLRILPSAPQWNVVTGDFQWNFDTDNNWLVKGLDIRGTDVNGNVEIDSSVKHEFFDCIFRGNGSGDSGISVTDDNFLFTVFKSRFFNHQNGINNSTVDVFGKLLVENSLFNGKQVGTSRAINGVGFVLGDYYAENIYMFGYTNGNLNPSGTLGKVYCRNCWNNSIEGGNNGGAVFYEDFNLVIGDNTYVSNYDVLAGGGNGTVITNIINQAISATSTIRSGGGPKTIRVQPSSNTNSDFQFGRIKLFEYPIYTNTSSKQYDVYFRVATSTAEWTANPTVSELWIECNYWNFPTNATSTRVIKKSTGTVDFAGSTNWQNLSVTCQPTNTGILYLRGWYGKLLESGQTNQFLIDSTPVIQ